MKEFQLPPDYWELTNIILPSKRKEPINIGKEMEAQRKIQEELREHGIEPNIILPVDKNSKKSS